FDVSLFDGAGELAAELRGLHLRLADGALANAVPPRWLVQLDWIERLAGVGPGPAAPAGPGGAGRPRHPRGRAPRPVARAGARAGRRSLGGSPGRGATPAPPVRADRRARPRRAIERGERPAARRPRARAAGALRAGAGGRAARAPRSARSDLPGRGPGSACG